MTTPATFADQLAALRQRATIGEWLDRQDANDELKDFLANHAEAIEKVVRAAVEVVHSEHKLLLRATGVDPIIRHTSIRDRYALRDALNELEGKG